MKSKTDELYECLENNLSLFELPITVEDGCDVFPILFDKMDQYLHFIQNNNCIMHYYDNAKRIVNRLKEAIEEYWKGNTNIANDKIKEILDNTKKLNGKLVISTIEECLSEDEKKQLYKARVGGFYPFREDEMFHIPFNKRGLIQNQRYSINGMPCLYLGTSTYVCWEELGRPDFNSFWVSRFEVLNKKLTILNFSYTIQDIFDLRKNKLIDEELEKRVSDYFLYWIIQCACSISVKNKTRVFREEYIIPQLIMQNIRRSNIDGIMYFSVRGTYMERYSSWIMKNFAFPADDYDVFSKNNPKNIFDSTKYNEYKLSKKLRESFSLTAPLNMGLIKVVESDNAMGRASKKVRYINEAISKGISSSSNNTTINLYRTGSTITLSEKYYLRYEYTNFYELEVALSTMFANNIT